MKTRFAVFAVVVQSILLVAHAFVYETWRSLHGAEASSPLVWVTLALAMSFVGTSLLAFRYSNAVVRLFYTLAAAWLGIFSYLFLAAMACWVIYAAGALFSWHINGRLLTDTVFTMGAAVGLYGIVNAAGTRVKRITVRIPNLPESWRGRAAALVSDMHLGHVRHYGFARRIARMVSALKPDAVFIAGDLYDGTAADFARLAQPWKDVSAPLGAYFVTGNHEGIRPRAHYLDAVRDAGVRVLQNEKVTLDGLQLVGVNYVDSTQEEHFRSVLRGMDIDRDKASVLLTHVPGKLNVAEEAGIGLQLSGHTHGGQFFPYTWLTSRIWGPFTYGLKRFGKMLVYTSCGAGTWGPPLRVGTNPEIVLIEFA